MQVGITEHGNEQGDTTIDQIVFDCSTTKKRGVLFRRTLQPILIIG
jgi:hypothetical protein